MLMFGLFIMAVWLTAVGIRESFGPLEGGILILSSFSSLVAIKMPKIINLTLFALQKLKIAYNIF